MAKEWEKKPVEPREGDPGTHGDLGKQSGDIGKRGEMPGKKGGVEKPMEKPVAE